MNRPPNPLPQGTVQFRFKSRAVQSASLPGSAGPLVGFLRTTFRRAQATLGAGDRHFRQQLCRLDVLDFSHRLKASLTTPKQTRRTGVKRRAFYSFAANCGSLHLHGDGYVGAALPDISFRRQLHAARQDVSWYSQTRAWRPVKLRRRPLTWVPPAWWNQVDVAGQQLAAFRQPQQRPVDRFWYRQRRCRRTVSGSREAGR